VIDQKPPEKNTLKSVVNEKLRFTVSV